MSKSAVCMCCGWGLILSGKPGGVGGIKDKLETQSETDRHSFNGLFSRTTWVSWHQKGSTVLDFYEARDDGVAVHQLDHMRIIYTSLQTDNH